LIGHKASSRGNRRTVWFAVLVLGWAVYAVSLAAPAAKGDDPFGEDVHRGLEAAGDALLGFGVEAPYYPWYGIVSSLSNGLMLWSLLTILRVRPSMAFGVIVLGAAIFNLGWLLEPPRESGVELLVGYHLWIGALVLTGVAQVIGGWRLDQTIGGTKF